MAGSAPKPRLLKCCAALASHTEAGLQRLVDKLSHACKEFGLTISLKKTNILAQDAETPPVITINNTELEVVDSFTLSHFWRDKGQDRGDNQVGGEEGTTSISL